MRSVRRQLRRRPLVRNQPRSHRAHHQEAVPSAADCLASALRPAHGNSLGSTESRRVERTTTNASVRSVADIHLSYMPYSHSVASAFGLALVVWLLCHFVLKRPGLG